MRYKDTTAHIIEVLTEKVSNDYKAFLRSIGISYIIEGKETIDYALTLEKLKSLFRIETLMLGGGGILNWSFIQAGMCDEVSLLIAPIASGSSTTPPVFANRNGLYDTKPVDFKLQNIGVMDSGAIWARCLVNNAKL